MCPRPLVWSEVLDTGQAGDNGPAINVYTRNVFQTSEQQSQLQHQQHHNNLASPASNKHHQVRPEAPDPGVPSGQARLCVSVCSEIGDKCLAVRDIMSPSVWCHEAEVTWPGCDQGAGQPGSPADCLGWSHDMWWHGTNMRTQRLIMTHLAVLLRWIQFAGPLHSRNMPLISNRGDWFTVENNIDTHRYTFNISSGFMLDYFSFCWHKWWGLGAMIRNYGMIIVIIINF